MEVKKKVTDKNRRGIERLKSQDFITSLCAQLVQYYRRSKDAGYSQISHNSIKVTAPNSVRCRKVASCG